MYQLYSYDVLGNIEDGYHVNNKFEEDIYLDIQEETTDKEVIKDLIDKGFFNSKVNTEKVEIDFTNYPDVVYIDSKRDGAPFCELRNIGE